MKTHNLLIVTRTKPLQSVSLLISPTSQNPIIVDFQVLEEDLTTFTSLKQLLISNNFLEQKIGYKIVYFSQKY